MVGQRLALGALGKPVPMPLAARREGNAVRVTFGGLEGGLHALSSAQAIGFELCDAAPGTCRFAEGSTVGNDGVMLSGDGKPVTRVRYAWGDSAITNLTDDAGLPVGAFEISVS